MTRAEHLQWTKDRAIKEINAARSDSDAIKNGMSSFQSDMRKHDELKDHIALDLMMQLMFVTPYTRTSLIEFIKGTN